MTSHVTGAPTNAGVAGGITPGIGQPQLGGDIRYGPATHNLTGLNATRPSGFFGGRGGRHAVLVRSAAIRLLYPEKRPFFLEGAEQFDAPFSLIYTRRIVQPVFASKLTGKIAGTQVGVLAAVDDRDASNFGDNPTFGILRMARDLGPGSRLGLVWTEQHDGPETNRVIGTDTRFVFDKMDAVSFSAAFAHDDDAGVVRDAPVWSGQYRHDGRHFRINTGVSGIAPDFVTRSGFTSQPGIANAALSVSYTWLWQNKPIESLNFELNPSANWKYDDLIHGGPMENRYLHFNLNGRFKGGWNAGLSYFQESFGYDPSIYTNTGLLQPDGTVVPFTGGNARLPNHDYVVSFNTPTYKHWDFGAFVLEGLHDENYFEWASAQLLVASLFADYRPTDQLRFNMSLNQTQVNRPTDGSLVSNQVVPVFTAIYQKSRSLQLRVISQFAYDKQGTLRDDARTGLPIVYRNGDGSYTRASAFTNGLLQTNVLLTYLPNPGTVAYLGYGTVDQRPNINGLPTLGPVQSSFFLKLSYLWRRQG